MINKPLLQRTLEHIKKDPDSYYQGQWREFNTKSSCGTTMCVAGWACELDGVVWLTDVLPPDTDSDILSCYAEYVLATPDELLDKSAHIEFICPSDISEAGRGWLPVISAANRAQSVLRLDSDTAEDLFSGANSPSKVETMICNLLKDNS